MPPASPFHYSQGISVLCPLAAFKETALQLTQRLNGNHSPTQSGKGIRTERRQVNQTLLFQCHFLLYHSIFFLLCYSLNMVAPQVSILCLSSPLLPTPHWKSCSLWATIATTSRWRVEHLKNSGFANSVRGKARHSGTPTAIALTALHLWLRAFFWTCKMCSFTFHMFMTGNLYIMSNSTYLHINLIISFRKEKIFPQFDISIITVAYFFTKPPNSSSKESDVQDQCNQI